MRTEASLPADSSSLVASPPIRLQIARGGSARAAARRGGRAGRVGPGRLPLRARPHASDRVEYRQEAGSRGVGGHEGARAGCSHRSWGCAVSTLTGPPWCAFHEHADAPTKGHRIAPSLSITVATSRSLSALPSPPPGAVPASNADGGGGGAAQRSTTAWVADGVADRELMAAAAAVKPKGSGGGEFGPLHTHHVSLSARACSSGGAAMRREMATAAARRTRRLAPDASARAPHAARPCEAHTAADARHANSCSLRRNP